MRRFFVFHPLKSSRIMASAVLGHLLLIIWNGSSLLETACVQLIIEMRIGLVWVCRRVSRRLL